MSFFLKQFHGFKYFSYISKKLFCFLLYEKFIVKLSLAFAFCLMFVNLGINLLIPFCLRNVVNKIELLEYNSIIIFHIWVYAVLWISANISIALRDVCVFFLNEETKNHFSYKFLSHIKKLPISFYTKNTRGDLISILNKGQDSLSTILYDLFFMLFPTIIEIMISIITIIFFYGKKYGLTILFIFLAFIVYNLFMSYKIVYSRSISNYYHKKVTNVILEVLSNLETIKYFNTGDIEANKYKESLNQKSKVEFKNILLLGISQIGHAIILGLGLLLLSILLYREIVSGNRNIGDFILINTLFLKFLIPLSNFGAILRRSNLAFQDAKSFFQIMDLPINYKIKEIKSWNSHSKNKIEIHNLTFKYEDGKEALKDVSFSIESGKIVSIVGFVGSGKSTISKLLFKLYQDYSGDILINGYNIKDIPQKLICDLIGIVPQKSHLFNNTIAYNIKYGSFSSTLEEVIKQSDLVGLDSYINTLSKKYDTNIGEEGIKLSGGQRQKISIARALLKNPEIYIFDEVTSSLDLQSSAVISGLINDKLRDKAILIISHDIDLVSKSDEILFLSDSRIVERGTHEILLKKKGLYWKFWNKKFI
jgi:ABC-type transport system involved in Fe-S cluster assembly fused permease/ATPase subunit